MNNFVSVFEELSKLYEEDERKVVTKTTDKLCSVVWDGEQYFTGTREECEDWIKNRTAGPSSYLRDRMTIKDTADINVVESINENTEGEEPVEDSKAAELAEEAVNTLVLECSKCGNIICLEESEVDVDEESDLANVDVACESCEETAGYKILGELRPYGADDAVEEAFDADDDELTDPAFRGALFENALTESKLLDNVKKVATRVGADVATIVRCFTELGETIANTGKTSREYKTTKLNDFMEYVENKAVFKALMNGNEAVLNGTTKEDLEELAQDIEGYKKAKAGGEEQEDLTESFLTEGKLLDNVKKVATRVGADMSTIVRCFTELGETIANTGKTSREYKTTKLNDFMEYVENKAVFKALMNGNEAVLNGTTKEDLEELAQDIKEYQKAKAGKKNDSED